MEAKFKQLEQAKANTLACLENSTTLVDMRGLAYWAGVVERLRAEIREEL